jgi:hypothetical protein
MPNPLRRTWKVVLVWFGIRFLNLRLQFGVAFVGWIFSICHRLRAA